MSSWPTSQSQKRSPRRSGRSAPIRLGKRQSGRLTCASHLRVSFRYDIMLFISCIIAIILTVNQPSIAAILTYASKFDSGELPSGWPHLWLLFTSVLASFAVGAGIIFERPSYPPSIHSIAFWLVIGGIAIEALCTIFLFVFDEGIKNAQQSKIIALETRLAPRHLEQAAKFIYQAKAFSGTKFAMSAGPSFETEGFAIEIAEALRAAGWQWISWPLSTLASARHTFLACQ